MSDSGLTFKGMEGSPDKAYAANGMVITFKSLFTGVRADFKAFVTNFVDNFNSSWASDQPYGKADPIRKFAGTQRSMVLSWETVAADEEEAKDNMIRISALTQMLYPMYENRGYTGIGDAGSITLLNSAKAPGAAKASRRWCIAAPPLMTVKFANLIQNEAPPDIEGLPGTAAIQKRLHNETFIKGLICAVDGVSINPRVDAGFFEIAGGILYPKVYGLTCQMTVLHQVSPSLLAAGDDSPGGTFEKAYGDLYGAGFSNADGTENVTEPDSLFRISPPDKILEPND